MSKVTPFAPTADHLYTLPPGTVVQRAKFGRTVVDVWHDAPGNIYRGEPKRVVGHAPFGLWTYTVQGECSGCATTEAAAKAKGERTAWDSEANHRSSGPAKFLYQYDEAAEKAAFAAYLADIDKRFG